MAWQRRGEEAEEYSTVGKMTEWLRRNFAQDDFAEDWYAWATNQISHASMGVMAALAVSLIAWLITGEYPVKWQAWSIVAVIYVALECVRGWKSWDSFEDTVFVVGYGAGGAFLVFTEIVPGSAMLILSGVDAAVILGLAAIHLAAGVWMRWGL